DARRVARVDDSNAVAAASTALVQAEQAANELQAIAADLPDPSTQVRLNVAQEESLHQAERVLRTLFTSTGELQHLRMVEFPKDRWEHGRITQFDQHVHNIGKRK